MNKKILFFDPHINERGTSVATYDYAHFNEIELGNESIIATFSNDSNPFFGKFNRRFKTYTIQDFNELNTIIKEESCEYYYLLKYGYNDGRIIEGVKNLVHVVFPSNDPHGDVYVYVSKWLANNSGSEKYVPHIINLPEISYDLREELNIPKGKFVFGWYGGNNFEIEFARESVIEVAKNRKDYIFLFMNQDPFCDLDNVIFINGTDSPERKVAFINTCNSMIHARERGETFGISIGEFSSKNKPVITYGSSLERSHIDILGDKGFYYNNKEELIEILMNISSSDLENRDWNCYQEFNPKSVMNKFKEIFLNE